MNQSDYCDITESFYKYQVWYFEILGVWRVPVGATRMQSILHQLRCFLIFAIVSIMLLFFAIRVLGNMGQLPVILQVFFMFATELSCMMKLLSIRMRRVEHAQIIDRMLQEAFRPRNCEEIQVYKQAASMAIKMRNYYGIMSLLAASLILVTQWFVDSSALPLSMYEPCNLARPTCYYILYLYHVLSLMPTCMLNISFDSMVQSLLNFLEAQLSMLVLRLENIGPALTPVDNLRIFEELKDCCLYFRRIEQLKDLVDGFIKLPGSVQLFCSVFVLVSNFYDLSTNQGDAASLIKTAAYQFAMLLQIFIMCYAANEVTYQSSLLCHALYSADWTSWNRRNRKMGLLMMIRFNSELCVRTLNHTQSFSLTTFSSIVNCSYSYFALLKRVNS